MMLRSARKASASIWRSLVAARRLVSMSSGASALSSVDPALLARFELVEQTYVPEHSAWASLLRHKATRGEVLSMEVPSSGGGDEKVFGIAFPTIPETSSGVAHILEHSVLCGSERYPSKEPFAELLRSSLQTFLNAMTYPDRTVYPVASLNEQDFRNLVGVYLDAVFRPRLTHLTMQQEGWRLEDDAESPVRLSGVVFSEMKGVYSNPDSLHGMACGQALFPSHPYSVSSGGDPAAIPTLSFDDFVAFHRRWYQPAHARAFFWGDDNVSERLRVIDEYYSRGNIHDDPHAWARLRSTHPEHDVLSHMPSALQALDVAGYSPSPPTIRVPVPADGVVPPAVPLSEPQRASVAYPATGDEAADGHFVTVCWALPDGGVSPGEPDFVDDADRLGLQLVSSLLMGSRTAPLYKALTDSGLGSAVTGGGLSKYLRQGVFEAGLKGVTATDPVEAVEAVVLDCLETIAGPSGGGFSLDHIRADLNSLEFQIREFGTGGTPKGLHLFLGVAGPWLYGRSPIEEVRYADAVVELRKRVEGGGNGYLCGLVRRMILLNRHRVTVHSFPSATLADTLSSAEEVMVAGAVQSLDRSVSGRSSAILREFQEGPEDPTLLATVPTLSRGDLRREAMHIPRNELSADVGSRKAPVLSHSLPGTNDIVHMSVELDLAPVLRPELLPYLPLFTWLLTTTGTASLDEVGMANLVRSTTGGISASHAVAMVPGRRDLATLSVVLGGKAVGPRVADVGSHLWTSLSEAPLSQREDILRVAVRDMVSSHEERLTSAGHRVASGFLSARSTTAGRLQFRLGGFAQLQFLRRLRRGIESNDPAVRQQCLDSIHSAMEEIRRACLSRQQGLPLTTLVADETHASAAFDASQEFLSKLPVHDVPLLRPSTGRGTVDGSFVPDAPGSRQTAIIVPSQVSYVCAATSAYDPASVPRREGFVPFAAPSHAQVAASLMGLGHLWDAVRVRGNAYGVGAQLDVMSGMATFWSYRDPQVLETVEQYHAAAGWLSSAEGSDAAAIDKAVISTFGGLDKPLSPAEKGALSAGRWVLGVSAEQVQARRDDVLETSPAQVREVGTAVQAALASEMQVCAVTSKEMAQREGLEARGWSLVEAFERE
jgi:presequence protease